MYFTNQLYIRYLACYVLALLASLVFSQDPLKVVRSEQCLTPFLRNDNGGILKSHREFSFVYYPNNIHCDYVINAPPGYVIAVQFNFMNIENENLCNFDYVKFTSPEGRELKLCGSQENERFISPGNRLNVLFHSDAATNYEGFELRYYFVTKQDVSAGLVPITKSDRECTGGEFKCDFGESCYPKEWVCDEIRDCRDNSDEIKCPRVKCHQSQIRCRNEQCISLELWCNGRQDCTDNSDEIDCQIKPNSTIGTSEIDTPDIGSECSLQYTKPENLNLTNPTDNTQIINGVVVKPYSWPWMVSLRYGSSHVCGASLLNSRWAITASHCVDINPNTNLWRLDLGRFYVNGPINQSLAISKIVKHPKFNFWTLTHDLALVQIAESPGVRFTTRVQPVCLPNAETRPKTKCVILGWGYSNNPLANGALEQAIVPIMNGSTCQKMYPGSTDSSMICAGYTEGGVDSCQGDSGGPLLCLEDDKFKLYGITSWGEGCALPNKPGVYANVHQMKDWIESVINEKSSTLTPNTMKFTTRLSTEYSTQTTYESSSTQKTSETVTSDLIHSSTKVSSLNQETSSLSTLQFTSSEASILDQSTLESSSSSVSSSEASTLDQSTLESSSSTVSSSEATTLQQSTLESFSSTKSSSEASTLDQSTLEPSSSTESSSEATTLQQSTLESSSSTKSSSEASTLDQSTLESSSSTESSSEATTLQQNTLESSSSTVSSSEATTLQQSTLESSSSSVSSSEAFTLDQSTLESSSSTDTSTEQPTISHSTSSESTSTLQSTTEALLTKLSEESTTQIIPLFHRNKIEQQKLIKKHLVKDKFPTINYFHDYVNRLAAQFPNLFNH